MIKYTPEIAKWLVANMRGLTPDERRETYLRLVK